MVGVGVMTPQMRDVASAALLAILVRDIWHRKKTEIDMTLCNGTNECVFRFKHVFASSREGKAAVFL